MRSHPEILLVQPVNLRPHNPASKTFGYSCIIIADRINGLSSLGGRYSGIVATHHHPPGNRTRVRSSIYAGLRGRRRCRRSPFISSVDSRGWPEEFSVLGTRKSREQQTAPGYSFVSLQGLSYLCTGSIGCGSAAETARYLRFYWTSVRVLSSCSRPCLRVASSW